MSKKDIFSDPDSKLAEHIASKYPALSSEEKKRIYALIQQKQGRVSESFDSAVTVTGVERRSGYAWRKAAGMAAVLVLIAGIGGSTFFLHLSRVRTSERLEAAERLTDDLLTAANLLTADITDHDTTLCFYQYSSRNTQWKGGDVRFSKVLDDRFHTCGEVLTFIDDIVTEEYMFALDRSGGGYFDTGLAELMSGSEDTAPRLVSYCGQLYASQTDAAPLEYTTDPQIIRSAPREMTVRRDTDVSLEFRIVRDGAEWKITDIERKSR